MDARILISLVYMIVFLVTFLLLTRLSVRHFQLAMMTFGLLMAAAILNTMFTIIEEKPASFISYEIWLGVTDALTFRLQYFFTYPAFVITKSPYAAHAVNIAVQVMCFVLALKYILKNDAPILLVALLLFFPSYYHYTIFGLRDPYINLIATLVVIVALQDNMKILILGGAVLAISTFFARPEIAPIIATFIALRLFQRMTLTQKTISLIGYAALAYVSLLYMPLVFGLVPRGTVAGNIEQIVLLNESRQAIRQGTDGGGSHILGGALYNMPMIQRYPIQVISSFVAPLPFEIRRFVQAIGFLESIIFVYVTWMAWSRTRTSDVGRYVFYCGMIYMLIQALFVMNYGNLLRMRYPVYIFFIGAWARGYMDMQTRTQRASQLAVKNSTPQARPATQSTYRTR